MSIHVNKNWNENHLKFNFHKLESRKIKKQKRFSFLWFTLWWNTDNHDPISFILSRKYVHGSAQNRIGSNTYTSFLWTYLVFLRKWQRWIFYFIWAIIPPIKRFRIADFFFFSFSVEKNQFYIIWFIFLHFLSP